jgi:hypothetical protein
LRVQPVGGAPALAGGLLDEDVALWGPILRNKAGTAR